MAREAKLIITSENKAEAGIKSAVASIGNLDAAAKKAGEMLKNAFAATAIIAGLEKLGTAALDCVKEFGDMDRTMTQLRVALGGNEQSFGRLTRLIDDMAGKTLASKDEVEGLVAELASLGKSDADIERITEASVALSNVTGKDLNAAFTMINATFSGTAGKLDKLVPEVGDLTKEQLAAGDAVDLLNRKFGAISDSMAGGITQQMNNLGKSWGDFKEAIGADLAPLFSPMISWIQQIADKWTASLTTHGKYMAAVRKAADERSIQDNIDIAVGQQQGIAKKLEAARAQVESDRRGGLVTTESQKKVDELVSQYKALTDTIRTLNDRLKTTEGERIAPASAAASGSSSASEGMGLLTPDELARAFGMSFGMLGNPAGITMGQSASPLEGTGKGAGIEGIGGILNVIGPLVDAFGSMLAPLASVQALMDPLGTILAGVFEVLGPIIDDLLGPLVGILKIVGQTIGKMLAPALEMLKPIIDAIVKVFVFLYNNVVVPIYNGLMWVFNQIYNAFAGFINGILKMIDKIPGVKLKYRVAERDDDAGFLDKISIEDASAAGTSSSSSSSGGGGASYTGSQPITFNFYNQGNVVGSGGLEELAYLIDSIIKRNARYA